MNKTLQQGCSLTEPQDEHFPLIIDRDPRAVQHTISMDASIKYPFWPLAENVMNPPALGTAPSTNKVIGQDDGEKIHAFDASNSAISGEQLTAKRLKVT
jgi:hypothetical protein